ncbi:HTH_48 domain-containing protein [Trichonephila inaurata madagascariensis]|uniref:HTH_48 domain-containing protein n=1 Tax=Trichonephila inaurata madagascariensis TaxID=2747483 RepID=A0A8X6YXA4_9ARAC|nr:HTH_48 domain-containing protein [Trichonephila inaurata madagascariensis]
MVTVYWEKCVSYKSVRKWSARFRAGRESVGDDQRPALANTVITSDLIDKVDDLVRHDRSACHITNVGAEGGCQLWNRVDNCSRQVAISEGVCRLGSEEAHRSAKETAYGTSAATSVSVS